MGDVLRVNRSRLCRCCGRPRHRLHLPAPTPTDLDYKVAWCPTCDGPLPEPRRG